MRLFFRAYRLSFIFGAEAVNVNGVIMTCHDVIAAITSGEVVGMA